MSTVAAAWTRVIVDYAAARGLDPAPALDAAGVAADDLARPDARLPAQVDDHLWGALGGELGDPDLGVHLSEQATTTGSFGVVGYVARASATVGEAIAIGERYHRLIKDDGHVEVRRGPRGATVIEGPSPARGPWPRAVAEAILANYVTLARAWTGVRVTPVEVRFAHPRPARVGELERFFGCAVRFGAAEHAVTFSRDTLALRLVTADPTLLAFLEPSAARALDDLGEPDLAAEVRAAIAAGPPDAEPSLARVARRLGTSPRSLQRRLRAAGLSFRALVDDARRARALPLLRAGVPLTDAATRAGFSDPRALRRALRRWAAGAAGPERGATGSRGAV